MLLRLPSFVPATTSYSRRWIPTVPAIEPAEGVAGRVEVLGHYEPVMVEGRLYVKAGDISIAYAPFCRFCRFVDHPTSACPTALAEETRRTLAAAAHSRIARERTPPPAAAAVVDPMPAAMAPMQGLGPLHAAGAAGSMPPPPPLHPGAAGPSSDPSWAVVAGRKRPAAEPLFRIPPPPGAAPPREP